MGGDWGRGEAYESALCEYVGVETARWAVERAMTRTRVPWGSVRESGDEGYC